MYSLVSKSLSRVLVLAIAAALPVALAAQDSAKPPAKPAAADAPSKWDIFVGYSYLAPHATVNGTTFQSINFGSTASVTRYFNKNLGVQIEGSEHTESQDPNPLHNHVDNANDDFGGGSAGLIYRWPTGNVTPFVHALVGGERVGGVYFFDNWGVLPPAAGWTMKLRSSSIALRSASSRLTISTPM